MKKICAAVLAVICLLLCACNGGGEKPDGKNYVFSHRGTAIAIGEKAPAVLEALKDLNPQISPSASCYNSVPGQDVAYVYPGFCMQTFRLRENDPDEFIRALTVSDDSVSTPEGITIGSTREQVIAAYGEGTAGVNNSLIYNGKNMTLLIKFRDGSFVTGITYEIVD